MSFNQLQTKMKQNISIINIKKSVSIERTLKLAKKRKSKKKELKFSV